MLNTQNKAILSAINIAILLVFLQACSEQTLKPWHTEKLTEEYTQQKADEVQSFADYLLLEDRLFKQLDELVYAKSEIGPAYQLDRYSTGSAADPRQQQPNWNRSFELRKDKPRGAVLLLHGMSDSPYALRTLGKALNQRGYWVVGLRMPGHGTAPSGLRYINRRDMAAAVRLGMDHLAKQAPDKPVHIVGYSTGAPLALEFSLDALEGESAPVPTSLVLISPAIAVHSSAAFARFKNWLSMLPGLDALAFLQVQPEFDPYKYNSFATNAGDVVYRITRSVAQRIQERARTKAEIVLPPTLVFKSTVDATVSTHAIVDSLLIHLNQDRHELMLFDINRNAAVKSRMLIDDPAPLTDRVMMDAKLPFSVSLVTNENSKSLTVVSKHKQPYSTSISDIQSLHSSWPPGVISLSHVALPIAPTDSLYGQRPPENTDFLFLGQMAIQGERGLLQIPAEWMLRLRYNPFYNYLENSMLEWVENNNESKNQSTEINQ